ncbi:terpene synthase family protein [Aspergillus affinis]|uniref:terpene synthase family protein n=1 Tax=Aspergillus affinis TaxID=1070780 RepID=UPI0022FECB53|nr:uncharacterized protein KD926_001948 [Aspergillus affinis]KAI9044124.1 hypothetical protein KD926_001948 [Aspergillus affinis]
MRMLDGKNHSTRINASASTNKATKPFGIEKLVKNENKHVLCPIHYIYNPFPAGVEWLQPQNIGLPPDIMKAMYKDDILSRGMGTADNFPLNVKATALPMPTEVLEVVANESKTAIQEELLALVEPRKTRFNVLSPLQRRAAEIRQSFLADEGGSEEQVLQQLVLFCGRDSPWKFRSLRDYMEYRYEDFASEFMIAGAKFSIGSRVDHHGPRMKRFTGFLGDQIAACNDIFSYEKERRAFMDAESDVLINLGAQIEDTYGIQPEHTKSVAYAYQLSIESELAREIGKLYAHGWE